MDHSPLTNDPGKDFGDTIRLEVLAATLGDPDPHHWRESRCSGGLELYAWPTLGPCGIIPQRASPGS